jgi:uncharacterized protein YndB with AHSA1/START domain
MSTETAFRTKPSLTIRRRLPAAPERCFRAWTDAKELKQWFGPGQAVCILAESDPRVGGRYRLVMRAPDGEEHDVSGVFREVVANRKLVFTWAWRTAPDRIPRHGRFRARRRRGHGTHGDPRAVR